LIVKGPLNTERVRAYGLLGGKRSNQGSDDEPMAFVTGLSFRYGVRFTKANRKSDSPW